MRRIKKKILIEIFIFSVVLSPDRPNAMKMVVYIFMDCT